jgi:hypothetical protein
MISLISLGLMVAGSGMGIASILLKQSFQKKMHPKQKMIPLKLIISHVNKIARSRPIFEKNLPKNFMITEELEEKVQNEDVELHIDKILMIGEELFANGAYLEVINHFDQAAATFQREGYEIEAHIFCKKANEIRSLVSERAGKLTLLEHAKLCKNLTNIVALYKDIIEISEKLNDSDGLNMYKLELDQIWINNNNLQQKIGEQKSEILKNREDTRVNEINLPTAFNFYGELKQFAFRDLILKRDNLEKNAKHLEEMLLFKSAAIFYEKCEDISFQLVHLGRVEEKIKVENYRTKKMECLGKKSNE